MSFLTEQIAGVALLGDGPELIGTPGVAPVAVPRVLHHLTGAEEKEEEEEEGGRRGHKKRKVNLERKTLSCNNSLVFI